MIKAYIYKELVEHKRKHRLLILLLSILIFANTAPVVLYFLPILLSKQTGGLDLSGYFQVGQQASIISFISDCYEIVGLLIVVLSSTLIHHEYKKKSITIPYTNGLNLKVMVWSKYLVYTIMAVLMLLIGFIVNHYYSGLIFNEWTADLKDTLFALCCLSSYVCFHVAIAFIVSAYTKSTFATLTITLFSYYMLPSITSLFGIKVSPYILLESLQLTTMNNHLMFSLIFTWIGIILLVSIASAKKMEL